MIAFTEKNMKTFRSINQIRKHYLPSAYAEAQRKKERKDPKKYGTGIVKKILEEMRQKLAYNPSDPLRIGKTT